MLIRPPEGGLKNVSVTEPDQVRAIDRVGNTEAPAAVTWLVDNAAPHSTLTGTPPALTRLVVLFF